MLLKIYFLFTVVPLFISGQSFMKTIPKPTGRQGIIFDTVQLIKNEVRPVVEISAIGFPGTILLTGGGFSYQHLKFIKDRWKVLFSITYMTWYDLVKVYSGFTVGILNNIILVGIAAHSTQVIGTLGIGFNFNN